MKGNSGKVNGFSKRETPKVRWKELVGVSAFIDSRNIAREVGVERLFLKFEGGNPTGTQKDRIALALAEASKMNGVNGITSATCGNFGAALAYAAKLWDIPCHIFVPEGYHVPRDRLKRITDAQAVLHYASGQYEDAVIASSEEAKKNNWFDANPGVANVTDISFNAYGEIAHEIYRELRRAPNYVICPVGNGTTIAGIHHGFKKLLQSGKTSSLPRMVATSTRRGNPIVKSYRLNSKEILDLRREEIRETKINEPLTNWHSFDGQEALDAIYESDGFADYASDTKMIEFARLLRNEEGLNVLPASASTLAVLSDLADNKVTVKGTFVVILTGRDFS